MSICGTMMQPARMSSGTQAEDINLMASIQEHRLGTSNLMVSAQEYRVETSNLMALTQEHRLETSNLRYQFRSTGWEHPI